MITMLRLALRLHRWAIVGFAGVGLLVGVVNGLGFSQIEGSTAAERAAFAHQAEIIGRQISYLLPLPIKVDTMGGYLEWRVFGIMPLLFAIWAVLAGTAVLRGEEERGLLDLWVSSGLSRLRLVAARFLAYGVALAASLAVIAVATEAAVLSGGESLSFSGLLEQCLAIVACTIVIFSLGLLLAQLLPTRRAAAGWATALMVGLFLLSGFSRSVDGFRPYRVLSPFYYYDRSQALIPGGKFDAGATVGLFVAAAVLAALAGLAFAARDLGAPLLKAGRRHGQVVQTPSRNPLLAMPILADLYEHRVGLVSWSAGLALLAFVSLQAAKQVLEAFESLPGLRAFLPPGKGSLIEIYIGGLWFGGIAALLLAAYAITQVARWAAEDAEGRLEMTLSAPVPRWRVVIERAVALAGGGAVVIVAAGVATELTISSQDIRLDGGRLVLAAVLQLPFVMSFGGLGSAAAAFRPRLAVAGLSTFAILSYLLVSFGPLFKLPDSVLNFSVFKLYGDPLAEGVYWRGLVVLLAVTLTGFAAALVAINRREIGR